MTPPLAHVAGVPVEEMLGSAGPALLAGGSLLVMRLRLLRASRRRRPSSER